MVWTVVLVVSDSTLAVVTGRALTVIVQIQSVHYKNAHLRLERVQHPAMLYILEPVCGYLCIY